MVHPCLGHARSTFIKSSFQGVLRPCLGVLERNGRCFYELSDEPWVTDPKLVDLLRCHGSVMANAIVMVKHSDVLRENAFEHEDTVNIVDLLEASRKLQATNARDKVFGMLASLNRPDLARLMPTTRSLRFRFIGRQSGILWKAERTCRLVTKVPSFPTGPPILGGRLSIESFRRLSSSCRFF